MAAALIETKAIFKEDGSTVDSPRDQKPQSPSGKQPIKSPKRHAGGGGGAKVAGRPGGSGAARAGGGGSGGVEGENDGTEPDVGYIESIMPKLLEETRSDQSIAALTEDLLEAIFGD